MTSFKMKNRILAALLCLVTVGGIAAGALLQGSGTSSASSTLTAIQKLKNTGETYVILEIVPDTSQAAFAWYVGDSEPVNEKVLSVAYASESDKLQESYAGTTLNLQNNGLLGTEENEDPEEYILQYKGEVSVSDSGDISGGYDNNEWFKRFVLDWSDGESEPSVRVDTVSPKDVKSEHLVLADMVVISGGFYHAGTGVTPVAYSADNDIPTAITDEIISRVEAGMPLILDRGAYNTSLDENLNSNWLFSQLLGADPKSVASGVYGSVFYYSSLLSEVGNAVALTDSTRLGLSGGASQGYLATADFNKPFASSMTTSGGPFNDVLKSIQSENASRSNDDKLSEDVTMASVVRYLVAGVDVEAPQTNKSSITILALQPGDASGSAVLENATNSANLSAPATTAKVSLPTGTTAGSDDVSWEQLEAWTGVDKANIKVVQKTINEFVASSESVSGTYDMIYIGNDVSGGKYGLYSESSGLGGSGTYYAAVGSDGTSAGTSYTVATGDLTEDKATELLAFVNSGRLVVLAPYLCTGLNVQTTTKTPAKVTVDESSNMYKFLTNVASSSNVMRQDLLIAGTDGNESTGTNEDALAVSVAAVNIPTPDITFAASSPLSHGISATVGAEGELEYIFKVTNNNLSGLNYKLSAMLDVDGDGVYETDMTNSSLFSSVTAESLVTTDGNLVLANNSAQRQADANYNSLVENQYYRLNVTLPDWVTGSVSWRLSVESSDYSGAAAVAQSRVSVMADRTISVLQVTGETGSQSDLTLEDYTGVADKLSSLADDYGITMTFDTVDTTGVLSENLNAYDVVLVGYFSDASDSDVAKKLSLYNGNLIFANASMTLASLDGSVSGSHAFAPKTASNLGSMIEENYTNYPYTVSSRVDANDFLMYYESTYFTNMSLKSSNDLDFWIDMIVAVDQMSINVKKPDLFDGLLLVASESAMTSLIGSSSDETTGLSSLVTTGVDLVETDNKLPVYFTIDKNINNFHVGVRWKSTSSSDWVWDSNYYTASSAANGSNPLISLKAYTKVGSSDVSKVMGETFNNFDGTTTSSSVTFTVELLPAMKDLLLENVNSVAEIYIVTEDGDEVSASFNISVKTSDTMVEGNDFFEFYYVPDANGNYIKVNGKYILDESETGSGSINKGLGYFYEEAYHEGKLYYQWLTWADGETRPATHVSAGGALLDPSVTDYRDCVVYTYWVRQDIGSGTGTHYYDTTIEVKTEVEVEEEVEEEVHKTDESGNLLYDEEGNPVMETVTKTVTKTVTVTTYGDYAEIPDWFYDDEVVVQYYSKVTNMQIDDYKDSDGNTVNGTLFQIG